MPTVSRVARVALASDGLDGSTNGLDDLVALQDLSLTGKRTALLDEKITIQASGCWHDRFYERISNAAAYAELGPCFHRSMTLLASDFTSEWAQHEHPRTCARGLEALATLAQPQNLSQNASRNSKAVSPSWTTTPARRQEIIHTILFFF